MKKIHYVWMSLFLLVGGGITICCSSSDRPLATNYRRTASHTLASSVDTTLKRSLAPAISAHRNQSGFELLSTGENSLLRRIAMIEASERSLDIQYYMIQTDMTGQLLLEALLRAANRGVRVRILMDDLNRDKSDPTWSLLNAHRHIEIRVFNPFATRDAPLFAGIKEALTGFDHFTKRMHNKMLIADNQVAIAGGRNLGDSYFDASDDFNFRDIDVLAVGPIVPSMSQSFDKYWNDDEAFPITALVEPVNDPEGVEKLHQELQQNWQTEQQKGMFISPVSLATQLKEGKIPLLWAPAELAVDSPSKIDVPKEIAPSKPGYRLDQLSARAQEEFLIVSPYFVPGDEGTEGLIALVRRGVKVRVLTNSLGSLDVVAVHTGYRRYRQALVEGGVEIYEAKRIPGTRPHSKRFSSTSGDSLHSKIYVIDHRDVMIGSFNLDPRSVSLNTELVLVIHSTQLAAQVVRMFDRATAPSASYHLVMENNRLQWVTRENGQEKRYDSEPKAGFWRNIKVEMFSVLPFEDQL